MDKRTATPDAEPHFHALVAGLPADGRVMGFFIRGPKFRTRQAAHQWAKRRYYDPALYMTMKCNLGDACPRHRRRASK